MRPHVPVAFVAVAVITSCAPGGTRISGNECYCPATGIWPLVAVGLPCSAGALPAMSLGGVCAGTGGTESGQLVFGANDGGDCQVVLTFADGSTYSGGVTFSSQWLGCGSDPHGCGQAIEPVGLPPSVDGPGFATLVVDIGCHDGGSGDAASE